MIRALRLPIGESIGWLCSEGELMAPILVLAQGVCSQQMAALARAHAAPEFAISRPYVPCFDRRRSPALRFVATVRMALWTWLACVSSRISGLPLDRFGLEPGPHLAGDHAVSLASRL